jgi:uncharacterized membrane protein
MSDNRNPIEGAVDQRTETIVTQQPGYATTDHVTRDVAAEQRMRSQKIDRILWTLLGILEIFLGLRFVLKLIGANPDSGFSIFIYGITGAVIAPFRSLLGTPTYAGSVFEITTLVAMAVYALFFWILMRVIRIVTDRSTSRTITQSTSQRTPGNPDNEINHSRRP